MARVTSASTSRSLVYGLDLLKLFTVEHPVRGIAELADHMHVSRPTAHRYASTCLELGYLEQAPMRRYRLARGAARPGVALIESLSVTSCARPLLRRLREATGRTVSLAVLDDLNLLYLHRICGFERGQYQLDRGLGAGSRRPAAQTAAGRALGAAEQDPTDTHPRPIEVAIGTDGPREGAHEFAIAVVAGQLKISAIEVLASASAPQETLAETIEEPLRNSAVLLRQALLQGIDVARDRELQTCC